MHILIFPMHSHRNDLAGRFVMHAECCAPVNRNRHTVTLHDCGPDDPLFVSLVPLNRWKPAHRRQSTKGRRSAWKFFENSFFWLCKYMPVGPESLISLATSGGDVAHCPWCAKGSGISEVNICRPHAHLEGMCYQSKLYLLWYWSSYPNLTSLIFIHAKFKLMAYSSSRAFNGQWW